MKKIMFNDKCCLTQAVLERRKTMTRRIVPKCILDKVEQYQEDYYAAALESLSFEEAILNMVTGERMFQQHVFRVGEVVAIAQKYQDIPNPFAGIGTTWRDAAGWRNKMFVRAEDMPNHIRITDIKIEHLQDISDEDCLREGVKRGYIGYYVDGLYVKDWEKESHQETEDGKCLKLFPTPREAFAALIDKVGKKGTWNSNPWVFVYSFEVVD